MKKGNGASVGSFPIQTHETPFGVAFKFLSAQVLESMNARARQREADKSLWGTPRYPHPIRVV